MKLNMKVRYGLRTMIEISTHESSSGILQKEISASQEIPLKYLDSIISGLRNTGLIVNFSGKRSGYILTRHPSEITVYDIYRAFEPELTLVNCTTQGVECNLLNSCFAKDFWCDLNTEIKHQMESSTLAQLVNKTTTSININ